MSQDCTLTYEDLIQLVLFPDGASLSSRLQRASVFQRLFEKDAASHEKAVRIASLVNQEAIRALDQRLNNWRSGMVPLDLRNFSNPTAAEQWAKETEKQLRRLLKGVSLLAGFKADMTVAANGIKLLEPTLDDRDTYTILMWIEDLLGFQQGLPVSASIRRDGSDERLLDINSEDCFLRLQVWRSGNTAAGRPSPGLVAEVRVPVPKLPQNGEEFELQLPVFARTSASADSKVPVYDPQAPNTLPAGFSPIAQLHLLMTVAPDKPEVKDIEASEKGDAREDKRAKFYRTKTGLNFRAGYLDSDELKKLVRQRWASVIKTVVRQQRLLVRSRANREQAEAVAASHVLQQPGGVQEAFRYLMDQIWQLWTRKTELEPQDSKTMAAVSVRSPSLAGAQAAGALIVDEQPLYYILKSYDSSLNDVVQNLDVVGKYMPDMTFFHPLFMFASMSGVRPLLFKAELLLKFLGQWNRANESLIKFVHETMTSLHEAASKDALTMYEKKLYHQLRQHLQQKMKKTLVQHYDALDPSDSAGRRILMQIISEFMPSFSKETFLAREVVKIARDRSRAQLAKCDVHKVDHVLKTLSTTGSEELQKVAMALGEVWEQAAKDFEADLGLEAETKDLVQIRDTVIEHYNQMREAAQLLIAEAPSWPYSLYGTDAMAKLEAGIMEVNKVLLKYDVANAPVKEDHTRLKLDIVGSAVASARTGVLEKFWYTVVVFTSNLKGAGTDSEVYINIKGNTSSSGKLILNEDKVPAHLKVPDLDLFEKGEKNTFRVSSSTNLGTLQEVELGIDGTGEGHSWHCDRLEITDESSKQVYYFECNMWLSRTKGDLKLERKLGASTEPPSKRQGRYLVKVQTSDIRGAGTDAYVQIKLQGSISMYETTLDHKFKDNFERGREDQFHIRCSELGNITEMDVTLRSKFGHVASDDWHLQDIRVVNERTSVEWLFPCNNWFNKDKLHHKLFPLDEGDLVEYRVAVYTSDKSGASTDARVYIIMEGSEAGSGLLRLKDKNKDTFERGAKDEFSLRCQDLGSLKLMKLGHDGSSGKKLSIGAEAWHVLKVEILDVKRSQSYIFPCNFWLGKSLTSSMKLEMEVPAPPPIDVQVRRKKVYIVTVYTSDITHAGTTAKRIFVNLMGDKTSSGNQLLEGSNGGFNKGQADSTRIECTDVGNLERLVLSLSSGSWGDSWHVDRVEVLVTQGQPLLVFPCKNWLSSSRGDKKTERILYPDRGAKSAVKSGIAVDPTAPENNFKLLDWSALLWPKVEDQTKTITQQYPPVIERQLQGITAWTPVSERLPYAVELKPIAEATTDLIDACLWQVITVIAHSGLRSKVAIQVLRDAVQRIVRKVSDFLKAECLKSLAVVQPRNNPQPVTIFDDDGPGADMLLHILIRVNTIMLFSQVINETIEKFSDETTGKNTTPVDKNQVRMECKKTLQDVKRGSFQVIAALHKAMRFGFLAILHDSLRDVPQDELVDVLPEYLVTKMGEIRAAVPRDRVDHTMHIAWASLLEAAKRLALGMLVWDLPHQFKLSGEQFRLLEASLKTLEIQLLEEQGNKWKPKESLLGAQEKSHLRLLLEVGSKDTAELQQMMLQVCLLQEKELSVRGVSPNIPYQGSEVVVAVEDMMELQQNQTDLDSLDLIRILRTRPDGRKAAQDKLADFQRRNCMHVLFGLPSTERLLFAAKCVQSSSPAASATPAEKFSLPGNVFVFTSYLCFTTLLEACPSLPALQTSDITSIHLMEERVNRVEPYSSDMLWVTLSDETQVELRFASKGLRDTCYQHISSVIGV